MHVRVVVRPIVLSGERRETCVCAGQPLAAIVAAHWREGYPCRAVVGGAEIPEEWWPRVRPRGGAVVVLAGIPADAAGARTGGNVLSSVLALAAAIPGPQQPFVAAAAIAVAIGTNLLFPPPQPKLTQAPTSPVYVPAANTSNEVRPYGMYPHLFGRMRIYPPCYAKPAPKFNGSETFTRVILAITVGQADIADIKIGETPIGNYTNIQTEFRRGWHVNEITDRGAFTAIAGAPPASPVWGDHWTSAGAQTITFADKSVALAAGQTITFNDLYDADDSRSWDIDQFKGFRLYPTEVQTESFSVTLNDGVYTTRTAQKPGHTFRVRLLFAEGLYLVQTSPPGKLGTKTVNITIQWSPSGAGTWTTAFSGDVANAIAGPWEWGASFSIPGDPALIDVRVRRTSYPGSNEFKDAATWTSLIVETGEAPGPIGGLCALAMQIKATGQLNGPVDQINMIATRLGRTWDGASWSTALSPTRQPAAMALLWLQDWFAPWRVPDSGIDLATYGEWWDECTARNWSCDGYLEEPQPVDDVLADIGTAGFASPTVELDGRRSVVVDKPRANDGALLTPANCWGFSSEVLRPRLPQAWRIAFRNPEKNYDVDERLAYAPGYSEADGLTITDIRRFETTYITDADQAYKACRRHENREAYGRRRITVNQDSEALLLARGYRVTVIYPWLTDETTDCGRVKALILDTGDVVAVVLDKPVTMLAGGSYALRAYAADGYAATYGVITEAGTAATVTLATPAAPASAPGVGYVWAFGPAENVEFDGQVEQIVPNGRSYRIALTAYDERFFADDAVPPPAWESTLTGRALPAPVIAALRSDLAVPGWISAAGVVTPRLEIDFADSPPAGSAPRLRINARLTGTDGEWSELTIAEQGPGYVYLEGIAEGETYDLALWREQPGWLTSALTSVAAYRIVGRTDPPQPVSSLRGGVAGGLVYLQWDPLQERDVISGGHIEFRHSSVTSSPTVATARSLGVSVPGWLTTAAVPALKGTYFALVYDSLGLASTPAAWTLTDETSVLSYVTADTVEDDPTWAGTHTNTEVDGATLRLQQPGGVVVAAGTYGFAAGIDLGAVQTARWRLALDSTIVGTNDSLYARPALLEWGSLLGEITDDTSCDVVAYARFTDDDPAGTPVWGEYVRLDAAEVKSRAAEFRLDLSSRNPTRNIVITKAAIHAEVLA